MVGPERDEYDPPRSVFSSLWFRALVVVLVLGVIAAVAVPYVLDVVNPPGKPAAKAPSAPTPPPAMVPAPPPPAQATAPPSPAPPGPAVAPSPEPARLVPKPDEPPKLAEPPKPIETPRAAEAKKAPARVAAATPSRVAVAGGPFWVQVGAFKDQATARQMAQRLRDQNYTVAESTKRAGGSQASASARSAGPAADLYDVFIAGTGPADIDGKLTGKGLTTEAVAGGAVVKPSLPLREAVALSRDLAAEGLKVQVRRAGGAAPASAASAAGGDTYHRVRVGGFPDRATAVTVLRELEGKGYKPFIARGSQ